ncbi:hypothetical protein MYX75_11240, partial [Acidobacteria bacterium AH-259-A15]|nr:hypothetical protein [Acidobacteria bacterium AH-259-A15]
MVVEVDGSGVEFVRNRPKPLFQTGVANPESGGNQWTLAPDRQRFLVTVPARERTDIYVVLNWFDELKR